MRHEYTKKARIRPFLQMTLLEKVNLNREDGKGAKFVLKLECSELQRANGCEADKRMALVKEGSY
jgi:hypothetical protein